MFKYGPKNSTKIRPGDSAATMAAKLDAQARELHMKASMLRLRGDDASAPAPPWSSMHLQDPEPEPKPHPDDGLPDPGNGRPCPPDTRGGCPPADPRPIPDPTPHPGGPVLV